MDQALAVSGMPVSAVWMSFDTAVGLKEELADNPTAASCATATGRVVRVSLRLESLPVPPSVRLYTNEHVYGRPRVLAADGDLLLINMVLTVEDELPGCYPDNFLVYKADAQSPWLRYLPSPVDWIDDWWPWMPRLPRLLHRIGRRENAAIARSGEDFFVTSLNINYVSDGTGDNGEEVADLVLYSSEKNMWEAKRLSMPADPHKEFVNCRWSTDAVFSSAGFICWVDYVRGILRYSTSSMDSQLSLVRFPGIEMWEHERGVPARLRTVSVLADGGLLKFVDVDNGRYRSTKNDGRCTITTWILRMPELEWEKDTTFQLDDLWSLPNFRDSPLPRIVPTYPVINGQDANIVHFILDEDDKTWIITVDIKNMSLRSYHLELDRMNQAIFRRKRVCSDVCKYLSNP